MTVTVASTDSRTAYGLHVVFWLILLMFPVSLSGSGNVNVTQFVLHGLMAAYIFFSAFVVRSAVPARLPFSMFSALLILLFSSLAYFAMLTSFNYKSGVVGDVADVFRPVVYFVYFVFPFLVPISSAEITKLLRLLFGLAALTVLFSMAVYFSQLWPVVNTYKGRTSDDSVVFHFFRWSGTHGYPSDFSFFLSFFLYFLFIARQRFLSRTSHYGLLIVFGIGLVMTMSRGGIASVFLVMCVGAVIFGRTKVLMLIAGIAAAALFSLVVAEQLLDENFINPRYVLDLVEQGTEAESARHRVKELALAVEYGSRYFPVGLGAARDEIYSRIRVVESLYGHYFIKWGLLGFLLYMMSVVYLAHASWRVWADRDELIIRYFGGAFFLLTLSVPLIFGFSSAITDRFKGLPFFYVLAGYIAVIYERRRMERRPHSEAAALTT